MPSRTQVRVVLYYLRRYLKGNADRKRRLLRDFQRANGRPMETSQLYRHIALTTPPGGDYLMFYLLYLARERAIVPCTGKTGLFSYAFPELLKADNKARSVPHAAR